MKRIFILLAFTLLRVPVVAILPSDWPDDGVLVMPEMGNRHTVAAINSATKSLKIAMYRIDDRDCIDAVIRAKERGVEVQIIMNTPDLTDSPFNTADIPLTIEKLKTNKKAIERFVENGIIPHYFSISKYFLYHLKLMIVDDEYAVVSTFNHNESGFNKARNFGLTIEDRASIDSLKYVFDSDYNDSNLSTDKLVEAIVLGPEGQREKLQNLLLSARKSICIYECGFNDQEICLLVANRAKEGIKVKIITTPNIFGQDKDTGSAWRELIAQCGGEVHIQEDPYIHAKVIVIDHDFENAGRMYVGSCNFWKDGLDNSREIGIITNKPKEIEHIIDVFNRDWAKSYTEYRNGFDEQVSSISMIKDTEGLYPKEYKISTEDPDLLLTTQHFEVGLHKKQILPGILQIRPLGNIRSSWDEWEDQHWIEFLGVVRLVEWLLIDTFEPRAYDLDASRDTKVINCIGKQRDKDAEEPGITFDIVPRYKFPVTIALPSSCKSIDFADKEYAYPFSFKGHPQTDEELRNRIGVLLRNRLAYEPHAKFSLQASHGKLERCLHCRPFTEGDYGLYDLLESPNFRVALHGKDQAKRGRCIVTSLGHHSALRYWRDPSLIVEFGNIFSSVRKASQTLYASDGEVGGFDVMWLMNNFEKDGGIPHTHAHIIPRYKDDSSYGQEYPISSPSYIAVPPEKLPKAKEEYSEAIKVLMNKRSEAA